jgi:MtN3 and saliva related transmembrane protein
MTMDPPTTTVTHQHLSSSVAGVLLCATALASAGCEELSVRNASSLLVPSLMRSELIGLIAGFGTTFAVVPDLIAMLRRRSSIGMNPRMAAIMGVFQIAWVYYGLLILSRPVVAWNTIAVLINFLSVGAFFYFARTEKNPTRQRSRADVNSAGSA